MLLNCVGETLESPLDCKVIKPVNSKGNQPWLFIWRTDAEAPILWPPDVKSWLTGKDLMLERWRAGKGDDRGWDGWMASLTQWMWIWTNSEARKTEKDIEAWCAAVHMMANSWTQLSNWTTMIQKDNLTLCASRWRNTPSPTTEVLPKQNNPIVTKYQTCIWPSLQV